MTESPLNVQLTRRISFAELSLYIWSNMAFFQLNNLSTHWQQFWIMCLDGKNAFVLSEPRSPISLRRHTFDLPSSTNQDEKIQGFVSARCKKFATVILISLEMCLFSWSTHSFIRSFYQQYTQWIVQSNHSY